MSELEPSRAPLLGRGVGGRSFSVILSHMFLITALGNTGDKYARTRHNAGFIVVDALLNEEYEWYAEKELKGEVIMTDNEALYLKPSTMMNLSGEAVRAVIKKYPDIIPEKNVIVIHDDIDLNLGEFKISYDRGSAHHNGVESVTAHLGTQAYTRIRIGINHPGPIPMANYVLMKFTDDEVGVLHDLAPQVGKAVGLIMQYGVERAMNEMN